MLHVGVRQGIEAADLSDLLAEIDGTVLKDRTSWSFPVLVRVPSRTGGTAILRMLVRAARPLRQPELDAWRAARMMVVGTPSP